MVKNNRKRTNGRVIRPLASATVAPGSSSFLASGSRLMGIRGENTTSPTYDFVISMTTWDNIASATRTVEWKYCGIPNGVYRNLTKDYPYPATTSTTSAGAGSIAYQIISGTNTSLEFYGSTGTIDHA